MFALTTFLFSFLLLLLRRWHFLKGILCPLSACYDFLTFFFWEGERFFGHIYDDRFDTTACWETHKGIEEFLLLFY